MKKIKNMFGFFDDQGHEGQYSRTVPPKEQIAEEIRMYSSIIEPAFSMTNAKTGKEEFLATSPVDRNLAVPLEAIAVAEQGLADDMTNLPATTRQQTGKDLIKYRAAIKFNKEVDAGTEEGPKKVVPDNFERTGTARGIYQREFPFTVDAVKQLRKYGWMVDNVFAQLIEQGTDKDIEDMQWLNSKLMDESLTDKALAQELQELSVDYNPVIDTVIHLASISKGNPSNPAHKPYAYSKLQRDLQGNKADEADVYRIQKYASREGKQTKLDKYLENYAVPIGPDESRSDY